MKLQTIKKTPLFADLADEEQRTISARMRPERFRRGELLFRKGDPSEMLYLIHEGSVQLLGDGGVPLATVGPGSLLGDADALAGRPRSTGAQAATDLKVWSLAMADVRDLVAESPELGLRLSEAAGVRLAPLLDYLVERRLRPLRAFASLTEEELHALAERLTPLRLGEGICFCDATSPKACFCLVEEGAVQLVTESSEEGEDFVELTPGASFGEMAVLTGQPMTQTVRAAEESTLWVLERKDFEELAQQYPGIRQALSQDLRAPLSTEDRSRAVDMLRTVPLFQGLPQEALRAIARRLLVRHVPAGQAVFAEGSAGDALYLVESGEVQIVAGEGERVLATLRAGEHFGEMALLIGKSRSTGARAVQDTNLWMLYRTDFEELLVRHPSISLALNRALSQRLMEADRRFHEAHLGRIPLFRGLSTAQLDELSEKLSAEVFRRGEVICTEGEEADRMWFIESGQAEVVIQVDGETVRLATLGDGDFFGEMALLTGSVRSATVRALTDLELWSLSKEEFDHLLLAHPNVAVALSQTLSERLHATTERLTQIALSRPEARRVPISLPERRAPVVVPAARPARRPSPAFGLQRSVLGALQRLQQMAQDTAAWFGERSAATKLRLAAVMLLVAWLCGITAPAMLISSLSARPVQAQNVARLALTGATPPVVAPAPPRAPALAEAPAAPAPQPEEAQAPAPQVEQPVVVFGGGKPEATAEEAAPTPTEARPTPTPEVAPYCVITSDTLNVRAGPGVVYDRIGRVAQGEQYDILAESGTGWYLIDLGGQEGWVSGDYVQVRGAAEKIALAEAIPPTPTPVPPTPTPEPQPTQPAIAAAAAPAQPPREWDGRLDLLGVRLEPASVAPGQPYWRLVEARWANEQESQGKHHIYVNVLDENGQRIVGQPVVVQWHDGQVVIKTEDKPEPEFSCNFQMYTVLGAYNLYIDGLPSDKVLGMGLGTPELPNWTIHTSFFLTFQRTTG